MAVLRLVTKVSKVGNLAERFDTFALHAHRWGCCVPWILITASWCLHAITELQSALCMHQSFCAQLGGASLAGCVCFASRLVVRAVAYGDSCFALQLFWLLSVGAAVPLPVAAADAQQELLTGCPSQLLNGLT